MFIKRTKIFPKYFLKMIGGATFVFGGSTQNLLGVPLGVPIGGASGTPNGSPEKKRSSPHLDYKDDLVIDFLSWVFFI